MKSIKKTTSVLLILIMVLGIFSIVPFEVGAAEYTSGNFKYTVYNGNATITKYTGSAASVTIPNYINGAKVSEIGGGAFEDNAYMTSLDLGSSVNTIRYDAFKKCIRLKAVSIPNNVKKIEGNAFSGCSGITTVSIGSGLDEIGWYAFSDCLILKTVNFAYGVKKLGYNMFSGCTSLSSVSLPNSLITLSDHAFYNCTSLTSVKIPDSVTEIGDSAFGKCLSLKTVTIGNSVRSIGNSSFKDCSCLTDISIPNSVNTIEGYAFESCKALNSVSIGSGISDMGSNAFAYCEKLKSLKIAYGTNVIGYEAFRDCKALSSISIPNSIVEIKSSAFMNCESIKSFKIPDSVEKIGEDAFYGCKGLTSVTFGKALTQIDSRAFYYCEKLITVTIPDNVAKIGGAAFAYCSSLYNVNIGGGIIDMGYDAFLSCTNLKAVRIAEGTIKIGSDAFENCKNLTSISIPNSVIYIGGTVINDSDLNDKYVFLNHPEALTIYGKSGSFAQKFAKANGIKFSTGTPPTVIPPQPKPAAPSVTLSNKSNGIRAEWKKVSGAFKYNVYYKKTSDKSWKSVTTTNLYYPVLNTTAGTSYSVQVQGVASDGTRGNYSSVKSLTFKLSAPTVTLSNKSNGIRADWNKVYGASKYIVYYKKASDKSWKSATTTNNYYPVLNTVAGTKYSVQVQAVASNGSKGYYSAVKAQEFKLMATTVTLSNKSNGIRAEWKKVPGAAKYIVYYRNANTSTWSKAETKNLYYPILNIKKGQKYCVQVQAVASNGAKGNYSKVYSLTFK